MTCFLACSLYRILRILCQNKRRNIVSLTLNAFVNAQSECGFHLNQLRDDSSVISINL